MKQNDRTAALYRVLRFRSVTVITAFSIAFTLALFPVSENFRLTRTASANATYFSMGSGSLNLSVTAGNANQITSNDDWSGVSSVEGYAGTNLTATHGIDPQTVLNTEFVNNQLPNTPTNVSANKGNPSAFNAGGVAEFDSGTFLAIGLQGNVQANPYLVFYLNTTGRSTVTVNYSVQDIDSGSNDSVSRLALQYRVGETGSFTNIAAGFVADATDGGVAGRTTVKSVVLPNAANGKPKVQVRMITTNAANSVGGSTPDEWMGINNVTISSSPAATAAKVGISGRVTNAQGRGVFGAIVTAYDGSGSSRTVLTNPFGYYHIADITAGEACVVQVSSKRFTFASGVRTLMMWDDMANVNFVADN